MTGIDQKSDGIAAAAVDMLVTLLRRNQKGVPAHPVRWMLRGRWVAGETTRQIRPVRVRPVGIENELLALNGAKISDGSAQPRLPPLRIR